MHTLLTLAHPGHDHTYALGGQYHHVLWYLGAAVMLGFAAYSLLRQLRNR